MLNYKKSFEHTIDELTKFYNKNFSSDNFRELLLKMYKEKNLDPDSKAIKYYSDIKCTADALLSIKQICNMENDIKNIINVYKQFRETPIFFFPCEKGGINTLRANIFKDKIDYTLYDIKMYYDKGIESTKLKNAFKRPKTNLWLKKMGSFKNVINWLQIKNIFTNDNYNVYDLEYLDNRIIKDYENFDSNNKTWSNNYYNNLKNIILKFLNLNQYILNKK